MTKAKTWQTQGHENEVEQHEDGRSTTEDKSVLIKNFLGRKHKKQILLGTWLSKCKETPQWEFSRTRVRYLYLKIISLKIKKIKKIILFNFKVELILTIYYLLPTRLFSYD